MIHERRTPRGIPALRPVLLPVLVCAMLILAAEAPAIVVARPPAEMLAGFSRHAETIVVADVAGTRGVRLPDSSAFSRNGTMIWTEVRLVVRESWKGAAREGDTLRVWTPGGSVEGGGGEWVEDTAQLFAGKRYALFLGPWRGRLMVYGGEMGALAVEDGRVGGYIARGREPLGSFHRRVWRELRGPE